MDDVLVEHRVTVGDVDLSNERAVLGDGRLHLGREVHFNQLLAVGQHRESSRDSRAADLLAVLVL